MNQTLHIGKRTIGFGNPVYIIAELSANHNQDFERAVRLVHEAKECGADAVKLQTYTADTLTLDCDKPWFQVQGGTLWDGQTLHQLYQSAYTPWEWQPKLQAVANKIELDFFSTPFDPSAVQFLEKMHVPAYKIASLEIVDLPLIETIAATGKPLLLSTGMSTLSEIEEAVLAAHRAGAQELALLKCVSAYPAPPEEMNLHTIPHMAEAFGVPIGLSDHSRGIAVPTAATALGACLIEKHLCLSREDGGPDSAFSLEPVEFKAMVEAVRTTEKAIGGVFYGVQKEEEKSRMFRRSLFVVKEIQEGEPFTRNNVRSIRPAHGLHPRHLSEILGKRAAQSIEKGTPLSWDLIR